MRKLLLAGLLATVSTAAFAADAIVEEPVLPAGFSWTGAYVGAQLGYSWGDADLNYNDPAIPLLRRSSHDPDGFVGGIYLGYNYQLPNNIVLGVDADIAWSGADSAFRTLPDAPRQTAMDVDYSAALRARLGFAVDRWMPYVAGGLAVSRATFVYDMLLADAEITDTLVGWTLGGGVEFAATDNLIVRGEYRYADFGDGSANAFAGFPDDQARYNLKSHDVRIGVAYKF